MPSKEIAPTVYPLFERLSPAESAKCISGGYPLNDGTASPKLFAHPYETFDAMKTGKPYRIRALLSNANNSLISMPDAKHAYECLMALDFFVYMDFFMTPTAELADLVLPAALWPEIDSLFCMPEFGDEALLTMRKAVQGGGVQVRRGIFPGSLPPDGAGLRRGLSGAAAQRAAGGDGPAAGRSMRASTLSGSRSSTTSFPSGNMSSTRSTASIPPPGNLSSGPPPLKRPAATRSPTGRRSPRVRSAGPTWPGTIRWCSPPAGASSSISSPTTARLNPCAGSTPSRWSPSIRTPPRNMESRRGTGCGSRRPGAKSPKRPYSNPSWTPGGQLRDGLVVPGGRRAGLRLGRVQRQSPHQRPAACDPFGGAYQLRALLCRISRHDNCTIEARYAASDLAKA